jgi:TolC family type I secretion outer membrane protein
VLIIKRILSAVIIFSISLLSIKQGVADDHAKPLTLAALTDLALRHNPQTRLAWAEIKAAAATAGIAQSAYWPQLSAAVDMLREHSATNVARQGPSLSLNYLLLDFGGRRANARAARAKLLAADFNRNAVIQQVILQVDQAYYQLLGQQALLKSSRQSLQEAQANRSAATALHQQGMATIGDVYQASSALAQSELNVQQAAGGMASAQGALASVLGLPPPTPLNIAELPQEIATRPTLQKVAALIELAKQQRPDLLAAQAQAAAAQAQAAAAQSQFWPTVQLGANAQANYPLNTLPQRQSSVSLTVNIPIFSGFSQVYAMRQAQAQQEQSQAQRDVLAAQVALQVWQAYFALQTAAQAIGSNELLLKSSIQALQQAGGQYRAGVGNILTLLTTQATTANARAQYMQARLNWYVALAQLSSALGTLTNN